MENKLICAIKINEIYVTEVARRAIGVTDVLAQKIVMFPESFIF